MGFLISNNFKIQDEPKFKLYQKLFKSLNMELTIEQDTHIMLSDVEIDQDKPFHILNRLYHQNKTNYEVEQFILNSLSQEIDNLKLWYHHIYPKSRLNTLFKKLDAIIEPIVRGIGIYSPTMYFIVILINTIEEGFYVIPTHNQTILYDYPDSYELLNKDGEIICFISRIENKFYYTGITQSILNII